jgi:hypothetical protein
LRSSPWRLSPMPSPWHSTVCPTAATRPLVARPLDPQQRGPLCVLLPPPLELLVRLPPLTMVVDPARVSDPIGHGGGPMWPSFYNPYHLHVARPDHGRLFVASPSANSLDDTTLWRGVPLPLTTPALPLLPHPGTPNPTPWSSLARGWDQNSLIAFFGTMTLTPLPPTGWSTLAPPTTPFLLRARYLAPTHHITLTIPLSLWGTILLSRPPQ